MRIKTAHVSKFGYQNYIFLFFTICKSWKSIKNISQDVNSQLPHLIGEMVLAWENWCSVDLIRIHTIQTLVNLPLCTDNGQNDWETWQHCWLKGPCRQWWIFVVNMRRKKVWIHISWMQSTGNSCMLFL